MKRTKAAGNTAARRTSGRGEKRRRSGKEESWMAHNAHPRKPPQAMRRSAILLAVSTGSSLPLRTVGTKAAAEDWTANKATPQTSQNCCEIA